MPLVMGSSWLVDIHRVLDDVARMRHPLPARHELIFGVVAERIAHAAVPSRQPTPLLTASDKPLY
jgi:hypothetical protein